MNSYAAELMGLPDTSERIDEVITLVFSPTPDATLAVILAEMGDWNAFEKQPKNNRHKHKIAKEVTQMFNVSSEITQLTANLSHCLRYIASEYVALEQWIQIIGFARLKCECKACLIGTARWSTEIEDDSAHFVSRHNRLRFTVMESKRNTNKRTYA